MGLQLFDNPPGHLKRVLVMGILNITPDSFSDGGQLNTRNALDERITAMVTAGADIIDIGGESSRPFAEPISVDEELARIIPAIRAVRKITDLPISIDTTKADVASEALVNGANIINDISALRFDPDMARRAAEHDAPVILMHMQGTPEDMQVAPTYDDVVKDIVDFLSERIEFARTKGIRKENIIVDPGVGFGKSLDHNLSLLKNMHIFSQLGCHVLLGHSRKSFMGKILDLKVQERDTITAVISALCVDKNISIIRVHDVLSTVHAVRMAEAILYAS